MASHATISGHVTKLWPMRCQHKWNVQHLGMLKKKHDLFFIYHPFLAGKSAEIISEAGDAILGHELGIYVDKGRAIILWTGNTDCFQASILAWYTKLCLYVKEINFNPLLFYVFCYNNWTIF